MNHAVVLKLVSCYRVFIKVIIALRFFVPIVTRYSLLLSVTLVISKHALNLLLAKYLALLKDCRLVGCVGQGTFFILAHVTIDINVTRSIRFVQEFSGVLGKHLIDHVRIVKVNDIIGFNPYKYLFLTRHVNLISLVTWLFFALSCCYLVVYCFVC